MNSITDALTSVMGFATDPFNPDKNNDPPPVSITEDQENKAIADETEAEARRRRRASLRRVFTSPGANFVSESNIGRNTLTGE